MSNTAPSRADPVVVFPLKPMVPTTRNLTALPTPGCTETNIIIKRAREKLRYFTTLVLSSRNHHFTEVVIPHHLVSHRCFWVTRMDQDYPVWYSQLDHAAQLLLGNRGILGLTWCDTCHCGFDPRDPFYQHGLTFIWEWISNHMFTKVWDKITYPFPNFNLAIGVWE